MKRAVLTCLTLSLAACGGETYFNESAEDVSACLIGTWDLTGALPDDIYSSSITFYPDGTYEYMEIEQATYLERVWTGLALWSVFGNEWTEQTMHRYQVLVTSGGWEYRDGFLYREYTDGESATGNSAEAAIANLDRSKLSPGIPINEIKSENETIAGFKPHCDTDFYSPITLVITDEAPITFESGARVVYPDYSIHSEDKSIATLLDDGTGTYKRINANFINGSYYETEYQLEYSYEGQQINVTYFECDTCDRYTRTYTDRGTTMSFDNGYYQRRQ